MQAVMFGSINNQSPTGMLFSRDPANGENKLYGKFLENAQGEGRGDVHLHAAALLGPGARVLHSYHRHESPLVETLETP